MRYDIQIDADTINSVYMPYMYDMHRYLVFYGGAGSGKSYFIVQRALIRLMSPDRYNLLCVRAVGRTHRDSTFALFLQLSSAWGVRDLFKISQTDMRIVCPATGNAVIFKGLDDAEKLKSVTFSSGELTDIWVEEASEVSEDDFNQLDIRLRGGSSSKQITLSFNPIDVNHWLKKRFFDRADSSAAILHTTYLDNKFLDDDYKRILTAYKDTDRYYYDVYCLGQWGVYGKTVFSAAAIQSRISALDSCCYTVGRMDGDMFVQSDDGIIKIFAPPEIGAPYVIGGDTAGEGSDFFTAHVLDNRDGRQVAVLRGQMDESLYAAQIDALGRYYNSALVGIEANFSTYPIKELERLGYPRQYVRESEDTYTHSVKKSFGFRTTSVTRPVIIAGLVDIVRDRVDLINDTDTLLEMLTFVRNEKGRPEAQQGAHDDLVMALAIAYYIRPQQDYISAAQKSKKAIWTDDMYDDYNSATEPQRKYLIEKWGDPFDRS